MRKAITQSVDLQVPAHVAYRQWKRLEDFSTFMHRVEDVERLADDRFRWRAKFGGKTQEGELEICEHIPEKRMAWKPVSGPWNAGAVTFHRIADDRSKVTVQAEYEPEGFLQEASAAIGIVDAQLTNELNNFKTYVEERFPNPEQWEKAEPARREA